MLGPITERVGATMTIVAEMIGGPADGEVRALPEGHEVLCYQATPHDPHTRLDGRTLTRTISTYRLRRDPGTYLASLTPEGAHRYDYLGTREA